MEFAQKLALITTLFSMIIVAATIGANFVLLWFEKESMAQETIVTISTYGGVAATMASASYATLTAVRNCSLNKLKTKMNGEANENRLDSEIIQP